jgi:hypothetical protein
VSLLSSFSAASLALSMPSSPPLLSLQPVLVDLLLMMEEHLVGQELYLVQKTCYLHYLYHLSLSLQPVLVHLLLTKKEQHQVLMQLQLQVWVKLSSQK